MREQLGWVTNCGDASACPQNWVECSSDEVPGKMRCHVCGKDVLLAGEASQFRSALSANKLAAFAVVPTAGRPANTDLDLVGSMAMGGGGVAPAQSLVSSPPPPRVSAPAQKKQLYCLLAGGEEFLINKDNMVIGRSRTCDVVVPSAKVSRQHAGIAMQNGKFFIEDLGSANGVWRDGERINGRMEIKDGDVFSISEESLTFKNK
jgi:hypothetical protein